MSKTLGIYVTSDAHLDKIIKICRAARKKEVNVSIFFTHFGTKLAKDPRFEEVTRLANVAICKVGFEANNLEPPVAGLDERGYASQSWHAEMILDCDRYLTF